jgi:nucleotide-binding universal stress UspA family protein
VTYATLMVHLEVGRSNTGLLQLAGDLAERFQAGIVGVAACHPMQILYSDAYIAGDVLEQNQELVESEIMAAETEFRSALRDRVGNLEWHTSVVLEPLSDYFAREARNADLIITKVDQNPPLFDTTRSTNVGDLVMRAGRPVLIVPQAAESFQLEHVIIAWKDTRESRRAALDALPFLKRAARVTVVEVAAEAEFPAARARLKDVVAWLERHGVAAELLVARSTGDDATNLSAVAAENSADLIVAGAYGHSRLREWVHGGVTSDLLLGAERCSLVSH